jgi:hypothetical protein
MPKRPSHSFTVSQQDSPGLQEARAESPTHDATAFPYSFGGNEFQISMRRLARVRPSGDGGGGHHEAQGVVHVSSTPRCTVRLPRACKGKKQGASVRRSADFCVYQHVCFSSVHIRNCG